MAKNFTKSLGNKNLASLIPTGPERTAPKKKSSSEEKNVLKEPSTKPQPVTRSLPKQEEIRTVKKKVLSTEAPKVIPATTELTSTKEKAMVEETVNSKETPTTVTTFRISNDNLRAIKAIAFWDRKKIQEVFNEALRAYIEETPKATLKKALSEYNKRHK